MEKSNSFQQLLVWQKAHQFVLQVYKQTEFFPKTELYGLTSQYRRAAVSVAANIAEGYKKKDYKNKINFLNISQSSLEECKYYIILARDLNYYFDETLEVLSDEVAKLLNGYIKAIATNNSTTSNNL
ncbi:MAG: four helix bundle protein [Deinococcales bacterium]|nr:four helix bundle protein [Chitinophagaceae bacterium]